MPGGPVFRAPLCALSRALAWLLLALRRTGWPPVLLRLSAPELRGYALATAYMLKARLWTLRQRAPGWRAVQQAWSAAEGDAAVRNGLAGVLSGDDTVELIADGAAGFARREALYASARQRIDIATYYLQSDETGHATVRALAACAARGVHVRLLVDRFMTFKKTLEVPGMAALQEDIRRAGIALHSWSDAQRPYDSNHRKMIVIDGGAAGQTALVGGRNFADHYRGDAWRDVDLVVSGPAVAPLSRLFDALWDGGHADLSAPPWVDRVPADILHDPVPRFLLSAIGAAKQSVDLELAYFVGLEVLNDALLRAAARGVRVRLYTNAADANDLPFAVPAAYGGMLRLLRGGCAVHVRRGAGRTLHCKYAVVDRLWVSFGSHNLDYYSARFCCENNLLVQDARLAAQLSDFFESGIAAASPIGVAEVRAELDRTGVTRHFDRLFRDFQ